jgi:hypothetical protein
MSWQDEKWSSLVRFAVETREKNADFVVLFHSVLVVAFLYKKTKYNSNMYSSTPVQLIYRDGPHFLDYEIRYTDQGILPWYISNHEI